MKFKQYLNDINEPSPMDLSNISPKDISGLIKKDCKPFLNKTTLYMFRGIKNSNGTDIFKKL
jgi:hypothetical protein